MSNIYVNINQIFHHHYPTFNFNPSISKLYATLSLFDFIFT